MDIEKEMGLSVNIILQLCLYLVLIVLKKKVEEGDLNKVYDVDLSYIIFCGKWYYISWKGFMDKFGGIVINIGIYFFDMLYWIFGDIKLNMVYVYIYDCVVGYFILEKVRVCWFLSINVEMFFFEVKE